MCEIFNQMFIRQKKPISSWKCSYGWLIRCSHLLALLGSEGIATLASAGVITATTAHQAPEFLTKLIDEGHRLSEASRTWWSVSCYVSWTFIFSTVWCWHVFLLSRSLPKSSLIPATYPAQLIGEQENRREDRRKTRELDAVVHP